MLAYRLFEWKTRPRLVDIPMPVPGYGEVLVKIAGNGICQSDIHLIDEWNCSPPHLDIQLPMTVGHEIGGWVDACGLGVQDLVEGQACVVTIAGCGRCSYCLEGWNNYCVNLGQQPGMGLDGGLAEYVIAQAAGIVTLDSLDPREAAPLTDAGLSAYHAVQRVLPLLRPGSTVLVIGIGGLGHMAVMILGALCSAKIVVVDKSTTALKLAQELGADRAVLADETVVAGVRDAVVGGRVDAVLDFVGAGETLALAADFIRPLGQIVVVGRGHGGFLLKDRSLPYGAGISTTFGGSKLELMALIALAEAGKVSPRLSFYPLSKVEYAFSQLKKGSVNGRAVIVPDGFCTGLGTEEVQS